MREIFSAAAYRIPDLKSGAKPKPAKPPKVKPKPAPAAPTIGGVQPTLLGTYGDWGAYTASPGGKKMCFALAKPKTTKPKVETEYGPARLNLFFSFVLQ